METGHGLVMVRRDMRWYGREARPGWASKPKWDTTSRPAVRSVPPS